MNTVDTHLEDITRWHEHIKFIFKWKNDFMSESIDMSASKTTLILQCPKQRNDINDIFTSENVENMSLISWI